MGVSVNPPKTPVTAGSNGVAAATIPNVCKMPGPPAPFVPTPLPNIGKSGDSPKGYSKKVKIEGKKVAIKGATFKSTGDMASKGTGGGLVSANTHGPTKFVGPGSMDVKIEGKNVQLLSDPMLNNCGGSGSPPNSATLMGVIQASGLSSTGPVENCPICGEGHDGLKESGGEKGSKADAGALAGAFRAQLASAGGEGEEGDAVRCMLGVVQGKCGTKYANKSGATTGEFAGAADDAGMRHHPTITVKNAGRANKRRTLDAIKKHVNDDALYNRTLSEAQLRHDAARADKTLPQANPPGTCAAQGAIVLLLERECLPVAMTEEWFSSKGSDMVGTVAFIDQRPEPRDVFHNGDSVPPCGTCDVMLPLILCDKDKPECKH